MSGGDIAECLAESLAEHLRPAAPRVCRFMAWGRMLVVRADLIARADDVGGSKTAIFVIGCEAQPITVDGDLADVARQIWGDAWSAGASSEGGAT